MRALFAFLLACGASPESTVQSTPARVTQNPPPAELIEPSCLADLESLITCPDDVDADAVALLERALEARDQGPLSTHSFDEGVDREDTELDTAARQAFCSAEDVRGLYWMGRVRHDALRFQESVTLFDAVIRRVPSEEIATYAVEMVLAGLARMMLDAPDDTLCRVAFDEAIDDYRSLMCRAEGSQRHPRTCESLIESSCRARRRGAQQQAEASQFSRASLAFEELANDPECNTEVGDMLLFNALRCAVLAGDSNRVASLGARLEQDYPQSPFLEAHP